jgi:hypothetical protein
MVRAMTPRIAADAVCAARARVARGTQCLAIEIVPRMRTIGISAVDNVRAGARAPADRNRDRSDKRAYQGEQLPCEQIHRRHAHNTVYVRM